MFDNMPGWAKILLAVSLTLIVLAILGPVIAFFVKLIFGLMLLVGLGFAAYALIQKFS